MRLTIPTYNALKFSFIQTIPIAFSYFFISTAYGILLGKGGYDFLWAWLSSAAVYTGAFQFVLASFLTSGASLATVGLTALFMNSRHVFYGLSFVKEFRQTGKFYPYMIFTLTDETYSLYCSLEYPSNVDKPTAMLFIAVLARIYWLAGSVFGALVGSMLPVALEGIDFCLTALFLTIVIDQWKAAEGHLPTLAGFGCGIVLLVLLGANRFILPALLLTSAILLWYTTHKKNTEVRP